MEADILLIEDEAEFADYLKRGLTYAGYRVRLAHSAEEGLEKFDQDRHRLLILDVMLPGMNGMDACRRIREKGFTGPILMLTARNAIPDRVLGLDSGADDYLVKPFAFEELLARIRTLQRRTGASTSSINFADMELDMGLHAAHRAGKPIPLTRTEFDLLNYFLRHPRQVLTREELILNVWGQDAGIQPNILDVYIARLRRKIGEPPLIHTIYGIGYVLKEETV
ncbi:response regulator transcription factor [Chloroflexi bacterium CFX2]|jgi:two-component system response regulator MprA|nr:response regulator transcription factor [Anaerolineales bacterium]MBV6468031.1 Response regulator MprA [Anaerolineales bacterium]MDL1944758.1 response regulator transcription factor [Chloroflexi bacterium CFX2]